MTAAGPGADDLLHLVIREEAGGDAAAIDRVTQDAFHYHPFSQPTEHRIIRAQRESGALQFSLVATPGEDVFGHIAFSAVTIVGRTAEGWLYVAAVLDLYARRIVGWSYPVPNSVPAGSSDFRFL